MRHFQLNNHADRYYGVIRLGTRLLAVQSPYAACAAFFSSRSIALSDRARKRRTPRKETGYEARALHTEASTLIPVNKIFDRI